MFTNQENKPSSLRRRQTNLLVSVKYLLPRAAHLFRHQLGSAEVTLVVLLRIGMGEVTQAWTLERTPGPVEHIVGVTFEHQNLSIVATVRKVGLAGAESLEDFVRITLNGHAVRGQSFLLAHVSGRVEHVVWLTVVHV